MEVFTVQKGMQYEGYSIVAVMASEHDAMAYVRDNQPNGFGDDYMLITAHTVGATGEDRSRFVMAFQSLTTNGRKWKAERGSDGKVWQATPVAPATAAAVQ